MQNLKVPKVKITALQLYSITNTGEYIGKLKEYGFELSSFKAYVSTFRRLGKTDCIYFEIEYNKLKITVVSEKMKYNKVIYDGNFPTNLKDLEYLLYNFLNLSKHFLPIKLT